MYLLDTYCSYTCKHMYLPRKSKLTVVYTTNIIGNLNLNHTKDCNYIHTYIAIYVGMRRSDVYLCTHVHTVCVVCLRTQLYQWGPSINTLTGGSKSKTGYVLLEV